MNPPASRLIFYYFSNEQKFGLTLQSCRNSYLIEFLRGADCILLRVNGASGDLFCWCLSVRLDPLNLLFDLRRILEWWLSREQRLHSAERVIDAFFAKAAPGVPEIMKLAVTDNRLICSLKFPQVFAYCLDPTDNWFARWSMPR
jgi:hypothetical protein